MSAGDNRRWSQVQCPIYWDQGQVVMLDQRRLPAEEIWNRYTDHLQVAQAIRQLVIRGAPAIGCAGAMGIAAGARGLPDEPAAFAQGLEQICRLMADARPTAVNLVWAVNRQRAVFAATAAQGPAAVRQALVQQAQAIKQEDLSSCQAMGRLGAELIEDGATVLTHCNTGALATAGYGTALGMIRAAVAAGKRIKVLADETRPFLQGARLTAWELMQDQIDVTVICDSMAGSLMQQGAVDCVVVGADRVARNGDVANKIGTYSVAVLARHHQIPFYVAAPRSTIDPQLASGDLIPIEQRPEREVTHLGQARVTPAGCKVRNAAFDVTPAALVTALITEVGIAKPPDERAIEGLLTVDC